MTEWCYLECPVGDKISALPFPNRNILHGLLSLRAVDFPTIFFPCQPPGSPQDPEGRFVSWFGRQPFMALAPLRVAGFAQLVEQGAIT